ncbi:hypothetical protein HORIV_44330 [Vreelandella olivaria]|uniref:FAD linked oxidase N-terminal domain-containing protein n=1 Tax=Vreelandella olivaria TaxID=390919 RepID=A0ABN5X1Q1_9GAMM|nr:hypothetical protein HORIV_44330 [Halomonas olivaria]
MLRSNPTGCFFAPELSTSNRATIGGMIATDASGQGSCEYGKTRDHVLELDTVLIGGKHLHSRALTPDEEQAERQQEGILGRVHTTAAEIIDQQRELIAAKFPPLNRCLTGYDLAHLRTDEGQLNLNSLLCGSEGSLGFFERSRAERAADSQALHVGQCALYKLYGRTARRQSADGR